MNKGKRNSDPIINLGGLQETPEEPGQALAVFIENASPNDPRVLEVLVNLYADEIYRLAQAILHDNWKTPIPGADILDCVEGTLTSAVVNPTSLRGKASIRIWLYSLTIRATGEHLRARRWRRIRQVKPIEDSGGLSTESIYWKSKKDHKSFWDALNHLQQEQRIAIILRHLLELSIPDTAQIMGVKINKVERWVSTAYQALGIQSPVPTEIESNKLKAALQARWPVQNVDNVVMRGRISARIIKEGDGRKLRAFVQRGKEAGILALITLAIIAGVTTLSRIDKSESKPLFPPTLGPPPTAIYASTRHIVSIENASQLDPGDISTILLSGDPSMTSDGSLLAFASSINTLVVNDSNGSSDLFILNMRSNILERVSVASDGSEANGASQSPSISSDGRYITFSSLADNLAPNDYFTCRSFSLEINCSDIFLRDLWTGITERINQAYDGLQANGHSYKPSISANGRWVVYWSEANNLVADYTEECNQAGQDRVCLDAYIYDRQTGKTDRVPIGRDYRQVDPDPITISRDGRYLGITIYKSDTIAQALQVRFLSEAFIYDSQAQHFEPLNIANDGTPGNHASYNARITLDGQEVVFVSQADNLIDFDRNNKADLFIRDLQKGNTNLVSISINGEVGNEKSGTRTVPGITGWGQQVSISDYGRYVAFISLADNLSPDSQSVCGQLGLPVCANVYVHDKETGSTELVLPGRGRDSFYLYVNISGDGRWVVMVEQLFLCLQGEYCSELWLYDRHTGRLVNPLRENYSPGMKNPNLWPERTFKHESMVNSIDFSPDGKTIATGTNDGTVRLWQISGNEPLITLRRHKLPVTKVIFTPDGDRLISSSTDGTIYLWQVDDGLLVDRLTKSSHAITSLSLSEDGNHLAAGGVGVAWLWERDGDEFNLIDTLEISGFYINDLEFSPDGTKLVLAVSDGTLWLYHIKNREVILRLGGHNGKVYTTCFSPDGRYLASGSDDNRLNLWGLEEKADGNVEAELISTFDHPNLVKSLVFSPDGKILASASLGRLVYLWTVPDGKPLKPPISVHLDEIVSLDFSNDGTTLAAGTIGGNLHLWQINELDLKLTN